MAKKPKSIYTHIIPHLRKASRWWPPKNEARKKAERKVIIGSFKNGRPKYETLYECAECTRKGLTKLHSRENTHADHIIEVAGLNGFDSWDNLINRMFCDSNGYQILCIQHHEEKTKKNQEKRKAAKKKLAKKKKLI